MEKVDSTMLFWNGVTPSSRSENLEKPLKAEVRDPLWMLCRQWQFGEFLAEDAAVPTFAQIKYFENFPVWKKEGMIESPTADNKLPLNTWVEASPFEIDVTMRVEIGQHWIRMLQNKLETQADTFIDRFKNTETLNFELPEHETDQQKFQNADILSRESLLTTLLLARNSGAIDGGKLLEIITTNTSLSITIWPGEPVNQIIDKLALDLLDWAKRVYHYQVQKSKTWQDERMEYQFELCASEKPNHQQCLRAEEYWGETIDWYQFDYAEENSPSTNHPPAQYKETIQIPSQVNYIGMPRTRWWEMEDAAVNFGNIKTTTDNPARLLFAQFNLVFGNDWFLVPMSVETGSLTSIDEIIVSDNFGFRTRIRPMQKDAGGLWRFFSFNEMNMPNQSSRWFYFPNTVTGVQKNEPTEQVNFVRDEMANMVWAIEDRIPDLLSGSMSGREFAQAIKQFLAKIEEPITDELLANEAKLTYRIAGSVAENWIPFIPVKVKNENMTSRQIQLQRAALPRIVNGYEPGRIRPKTTILSEGLKSEIRKPYYLYEEEVPRGGMILRGRWKRTRWLNGKTFTWYARERSIGRGEAASQLRFDYLKEKIE